jgi:CubicO group peptidase (beta-lactamase class C family)
VKGRTASMLVVIIIVIAIAALAAGCAVATQRSRQAPTPTDEICGIDTPGSHTATRGVASYWPTEGWRKAVPAAHDVDEARLKAMTDYVKLKGLDIKGIVVIRDGYLVFEHYGPGQGPDSRAEVFSVTKSFASTLIGIAQRRGLLGGLDEPVMELLPGEYANMDAAKAGITLEDALTMRAGLAWQEDDATIRDFYMSADPVKFILDLPLEAEPGTDFNYCSGCSHLLTAIVGRVSGMPPQQFAEKELFEPLGIEGAQWLADRNGMALGGWGLQLSAREMAKLGYLYLRGGTWDGQEIVTPGWVALATTAQTPSDGPSAYGYQWWTHSEYPAYMALGRAGQIVYVRPDKDLVVAMRAQLPNHDAIFYLIETYIEPATE